MVGEGTVVSFGHGPADATCIVDRTDHPVDIGDRTTLAVIAVLRELGFGVLLPFGENTRYDLVIDDGRRLAKVQCKTGRLRSGAVRWSVCSNYAHHPNPKIRQRDYHGEVDYFGVFCRENGGVYLVPIADIPLRREGALRIDAPRNRQRKRIRFADRYEIGRVRFDPSESLRRVAPPKNVYARPTQARPRL